MSNEAKREKENTFLWVNKQNISHSKSKFFFKMLCFYHKKKSNAKKEPKQPTIIMKSLHMKVINSSTKNLKLMSLGCSKR